MDPWASIAGHIFGLHSACCWGINFTEVRRVVKVFLDQFVEENIVSKARPLIRKYYLGSCKVINVDIPEHKPYF